MFDIILVVPRFLVTSKEEKTEDSPREPWSGYHLVVVGRVTEVGGSILDYFRSLDYQSWGRRHGRANVGILSPRAQRALTLTWFFVFGSELNEYFGLCSSLLLHGPVRSPYWQGSFLWQVADWRVSSVLHPTLEPLLDIVTVVFGAPYGHESSKQKVLTNPYCTTSLPVWQFPCSHDS